MAYQPMGDESGYMGEFTQNLPAIEAYKRQHGGDYEKAFQAVTGKPWPKGRSVKVKNGVPEMTKDRTFKSVMGKYVLPAAGIAATALIPGAAPAILNAVKGAGSAAKGILGMTGGKGVKEAFDLSTYVGPDKAAGFGMKNILGAASKLAPVLGGAAKDAAANNAINDANAVNAWRSGESAQLARDEFDLAAPSTRMGQSVRASLIKNASPTQISFKGPGSGVGGFTTTGGFRNAMSSMDPMATELASQVMADNLEAQKRKRAPVTPPVTGKSSWGDRLLGGAAFGSSILGAFK